MNLNPCLLLVLLAIITSNTCVASPNLSIKEARFDLELAITPDEHRKGLMQRSNLKENQGMLFIYQQPQQISLWMKNTKISLDILFFDHSGRLLELYKNIPPCTKSPCKTYKNKEAAQYVLEIRAGLSDKYQLRPGDIFTLDFEE